MILTKTQNQLINVNNGDAVCILYSMNLSLKSYVQDFLLYHGK